MNSVVPTVFVVDAAAAAVLKDIGRLIVGAGLKMATFDS